MQNLYADQLKAAHIVIISHADLMTDADQSALVQLQAEYAAYKQQWIMTEHGKLDIAAIQQAYAGSPRRIQPLLKIQREQPLEQAETIIQQLPYHYVEQAQGYTVAGWKLPRRWKFQCMDVLDLLCEQQDWLRIKAIFHTDEGWKSFNFNPEQFNYQSCEEGIDNRIEVIYQHSRDWSDFESSLLACRIDALP